MPYAVLAAGMIIIAISIYLAKQQASSSQVNTQEVQELIAQIHLAADDAIGRLEEKLSQVDRVLSEPQPPTFAQEVEKLASSGLSHEEIASQLGRGKGEIELALGIASFTRKEQSS